MSQYAPAVQAAIQVITYLSQHTDLGLSEISRGVEINKNMVFRILNTLEEQGWVYCSGSKYSLTLLPFRVTSQSVARMPLHKAALPILQQLHGKTGESTYLGILKGDKVLYIQHLDGTGDVTVAGRLGGEYELYCSAPGKALLAFQSREYIDAYLKGDFLKRTPNTIVDAAQLQKELISVAHRGYALDREEFGMGITCVAAPIFDAAQSVVGCIGSSAFTPMGDHDGVISRLLPHVLQAAEEVTKRLGGIEPQCRDREETE